MCFSEKWELAHLPVDPLCQVFFFFQSAANMCSQYWTVCSKVYIYIHKITLSFLYRWEHNLWTNKEVGAVRTCTNTAECFVSRLIVKAAFVKESNCCVMGRLSERTAKQSSSVWWNAICSNVCVWAGGRKVKKKQGTDWTNSDVGLPVIMTHFYKKKIFTCKYGLTHYLLLNLFRRMKTRCKSPIAFEMFIVFYCLNFAIFSGNFYWWQLSWIFKH